MVTEAAARGILPASAMSRDPRPRAGLLTRMKTRERTFMVLVAVAIGCLGGLGAVGFRELIQLLQRLFWAAGPFTAELVRASPAWLVIVAPAAGGLLVGPLVHFLAREAKGHGVPEVMEAVALRSGYMRARLVVVKSLASALSIACGGSVGREGPIVQIGSAIGSVAGQLLRISGLRLRTLVGCGAAAGVAGTFNAPVAGALFAVEIILGDFGVSRFSPIVISSVMATVVSRHFLGDVPAFVAPVHGLEHPGELALYLLLGVVAALVATLFIRALYGCEDLAARLWRLPPWLLAPVGGALIGLIGLLFPEVLGTAYEVIEAALRGDLALSLLLALLAVKLAATSLTIAAGFSGGVFAPSLFLGAMAGGALGKLAETLFPGATATSGAYALVGMGAVVAGTTRAPITAILIIFELTSDYSIILPLMASCIIATLVAERLEPESIYTMKLIRRGVDLKQGRELNVLRSLRVADELAEAVARVPADESFGALLVRIAESPASYYYVVDGQGRLEGVIALAEISSHIADAPVLKNLLLARDIARDDVPEVAPADRLDEVMRTFGGRDREELPVTEPGTRRLLGVISRRHLVEAYNRELLRRDMAAELGSSFQASGREGGVVLGDGLRLSELELPAQFADKTIGALDVRRRFGAQILLIRRSAAGGGRQVELAPAAETLLARGDRLVVMAGEADLERLRKL